jgi:hypothetical protein
MRQFFAPNIHGPKWGKPWGDTLQTPVRESSVVEMRDRSQCQSLRKASNDRAIPPDWGVYNCGQKDLCKARVKPPTSNRF